MAVPAVKVEIVTVDPTSTGPLDERATVGASTEGDHETEPQFTVPYTILRKSALKIS